MLYKIFLPSYERSIDNLILCNHTLSWLDLIKYLGLHFNSSKSMLTDISEVKRNFFSGCSCIYTNSYDQNELLQLQLQESYSLPILTYCTAALKQSVTLNHLNSCWNSVYRRLFDFSSSVSNCINGLGRLTRAIVFRRDDTLPR